MTGLAARLRRALGSLSLLALRLVALLLFALGLLAGCVTEVGRFAMLADFPVQAIDLPDDAAALPAVEAEDFMNVFVIVPFEDPPTIDGALQAALRKTNGDVLLDVVVEKEWFYVPFVYGYRGYRIRGRPVRVLHAPERERSRRSRLLQGGAR